MTVTVILPGQGSESIHDPVIGYDEKGVAWVSGWTYEDGGTYYMPVDAHYYPVSVCAKARWILACSPSAEPIR